MDSRFRGNDEVNLVGRVNNPTRFWGRALTLGYAALTQPTLNFEGRSNYPFLGYFTVTLFVFFARTTRTGFVTANFFSFTYEWRLLRLFSRFTLLTTRQCQF